MEVENQKTAGEVRTEYIARLGQFGFRLFPVNGKIPMIPAWNKVPAGKYGERELSGNYGIALSADTLVIDADPRNFKLDPLSDQVDTPLDRLLADYDIPQNSFSVRTGGGGVHIYLRKPKNIKIKKQLDGYKGLDFLSGPGCYVVGPGSVHPDTGAPYLPMEGHGDPGGIADAPAGLLAALRKVQVPAKLPGSAVEDKVAEKAPDARAAAIGRYTAYLSGPAPLAVEGERGDETAYKVACYGRDLGLTPDEVVQALTGPSGWNARCQPPWAPEYLIRKVQNAFQYATGVLGAADPAVDFAPVGGDDTPTEGDGDDGINWQRDKKGKLVKSFVNLLNFLKSNRHGLKQLFGYNQFTGQIEVMRPAPWHGGKMPRHPGIIDQDLKLVKAHLAVTCGFETTVSTIEEAVTVTAYDNKFHPIQEYLKGLKWDGVKRLDTWLSDYAGAHNNPYVSACGRKTLCAAVARVMLPGVKFDHILILEGDQGIGKSRLCDALGGEWYGDFIIDPHNKDTVAALQGKWIVEMSEMEVTKRTDTMALKAFISRQTDKVRLAYGRLSTEFPRQCIFIGTINPSADGTYLKDDTGNRRFWPVGVTGALNVKGLREVRNQLFAEAMDALARGEKLYMDDVAVERLAKDEVSERHAENPWTERVAEWIAEGRIEVGGKGEVTARDFVTARQVFIGALGGIDKQLGRRETVAIAEIMRNLGWAKTSKWVGSRNVRGYSAPGKHPGAAEAEKWAAAAGATEADPDMAGFV